MPPPLPDSPENGWQHIPPDWWRISVNAVSWAYDPSADSDKVGVAKPPRCPPGLFPFQPDDCREEDETLPSDGDARSLNAELVGLKGALGALEPYELDVGFHWPISEAKEQESPAQPDLAASEEHVVQAKEKWDELVQDLTGGLTIETASADLSIESDDDSSLSVYRSTSTHSSIDLTDSDRSVASIPMPSTPRARRSYANILVKNASPSRSVDSDRSLPRLNAAASIFVPSPPRAKFAGGDEPISFPTLNPDRTPTPPSPTLNTNFVFPSLNVVPPIPSVKITKDEQGFYSEVEATPTQPQVHGRSSSTTLLPSFLQETFTRRSRSSKTRAMVDKLKSTTASQTQARPQHIQLSSLSKPRLCLSDYGGEGDTPGAEDDSEGWIGGDDASATKLAAAAGGLNPKTRRTRELFLALTRRRSNSSPAPAKPALVDVSPPAEDIVGIPVELPSPASASTTSNDNDGWIGGSASTTGDMPDRKPTPLSSSSPTPERKATPADPKPPVTQKPWSQRTQKKPKRSTPSVSSNLPPPTHPGPGVYPRAAPPAPHGYYYPHPHPHAPVAVPVPYAAAYMHQMQVLQLQHIQQQQQQHQMHMRRASAAGRAARAGSGDWRNSAFAVPVPLAAYPMPVAVPVPLPLHHPHPHAQPVFVPHAP